MVPIAIAIIFQKLIIKQGSHFMFLISNLGRFLDIFIETFNKDVLDLEFFLLFELLKKQLSLK